MEAVANKVALVIVGLSVLIAVVGCVIIASLEGAGKPSFLLMSLLGVGMYDEVTIADAIPFAAGVGAAMCLNVAKVFLLKRSVANSLKRDAVSAKMYLKAQYFLRLMLTLAVLLAVAFLHSGDVQYVNVMGTFFGIFTFPLAMNSMRFFMKDALQDDVLPKDTRTAVESAIDDLKAIGAEENEAEE